VTGARPRSAGRAQGQLIPEQYALTSLTQMLSHRPNRSSQQKLSCEHTSETHWLHPSTSGAPVVHTLCEQLLAQGPQSVGQFWQVSPASHDPLGQTGPQGPQSVGQFWQVSPASHMPLGQTGPPDPVVEAAVVDAAVVDAAVVAPVVAAVVDAAVVAPVVAAVVDAALDESAVDDCALVTSLALAVDPEVAGAMLLAPPWPAVAGVPTSPPPSPPAPPSPGRPTSPLAQPPTQAKAAITSTEAGRTNRCCTKDLAGAPCGAGPKGGKSRPRGSVGRARWSIGPTCAGAHFRRTDPGVAVVFRITKDFS
jgi:hypothetical protein